MIKPVRINPTAPKSVSVSSLSSFDKSANRPPGSIRAYGALFSAISAILQYTIYVGMLKIGSETRLETA